MAKINTSHSKLACRKVHTEQTCRRKSNRGKETTHKKESETQSNAQWSKVKQWFVSEPYLWSSPLYLVHNPDFTLLIWGVLNSFEVTVKTTWLLPTYCSPLGGELTGLSTFLFVFPSKCRGEILTPSTCFADENFGLSSVKSKSENLVRGGGSKPIYAAFKAVIRLMPSGHIT